MKSNLKTLDNAKSINMTQVLNKLANNDLLRLLSENKLYNLYFNQIIDFNLYKALNIVYSYYLNSGDYDRQGVTTHNIRYKALLNNFKLWYLKSNYKLSFNCLKKILKLIKIKTYINPHTLDNTITHSIKKYRVNNVIKLVKA